ncbi:MAG: MATE family efflux transporter [bacterium]|nr:MATE family efflux transporter [bacterium]
MKNKMQLDKEPISSLFFKYYFPALTSMLSVTVHQIVDGLILGEYVGKHGVAAIGIFGPIITIFIAFTLMLVIGGGISISRNLGSNNYNEAQRVFQHITSLAIVIGISIAIIFPGLTTYIVSNLVGAEDAQLLKSATDYTFWGFLWIPLFLIRMIWGMTISHDGAPKVSRNATLFGVTVNIILDVVLVIVIPLGTEGASIATGIAVLLSMIYLGIYLLRGKGHLSLRQFKFTFKLKEWKQLYKFGIPSFVSEISFSVGMLIINKSLVSYGPLAVSAFGIINYLSFIFLRLFTAAMVSAIPIMSFNIGAKLPERVIQTLKFSLGFCLILGTLVSVVGFALPEELLSLFSSNEPTEFMKIGTEGFGWYFLLFTTAGANYILGAFLQSTGKTTLAIILYLLKGLVLVLGFIVILDSNTLGVWLSRPLAEIGSFILIIVFTLILSKKYFHADSIIKS